MLAQHVLVYILYLSGEEGAGEGGDGLSLFLFLGVLDMSTRAYRACTHRVNNLLVYRDKGEIGTKVKRDRDVYREREREKIDIEVERKRE